MRQTKKAKQVAVVSELDQALAALEDAKKQVRKELSKSAVKDFKQTAEQRKQIEEMFTCINPEKCKIYTRRESERLRNWCKIGFELTLYCHIGDKDCLVDYFTTIYEDDLHWEFLFEYFKSLLRLFIRRLHAKLSEHLDDLVSLADILSEIK